MKSAPLRQPEDLMRDPDRGPITPRPIFDHDRDPVGEMARPAKRAVRDLRRANPTMRFAISEDNRTIAAWHDDGKCWVPCFEHMSGDEWIQVSRFPLAEAEGSDDASPLPNVWIEYQRKAR